MRNITGTFSDLWIHDAARVTRSSSRITRTTVNPEDDTLYVLSEKKDDSGLVELEISKAETNGDTRILQVRPRLSLTLDRSHDSSVSRRLSGSACWKSLQTTSFLPLRMPARRSLSDTWQKMLQSRSSHLAEISFCSSSTETSVTTPVGKTVLYRYVSPCLSLTELSCNSHLSTDLFVLVLCRLTLSVVSIPESRLLPGHQMTNRLS